MDPLILIFRLLIFPGICFLSFLAFLFEWIDRKAYARFQNRIGPLYAGPSGILQPIADFIKLMAKEDITPTYVDSVVFNNIPILAVAILVFASLYIPIDGKSILPPFEGDVVLLLTLLTIYTILVFIAGWTSTNRFSIIGATRAILQFLAYEIPMFISIVSVVMYIGSTSITYISQNQPIPMILLQPLGFIVFIVALQAELERIPFDIPEAESEIVAGWLTEYCGPKLAFLRFAEDLKLVLGSALATAIFLGGGSGPILPPVVWFVLKMVFVVILSSYIRSLFARLRIDQMVSSCWKYLIPLSILQLVLSKFIGVVF
ncbi:MAG: NADH-quinone oxidoreductase subunit H [Candidatus Methanomethylicia archaeon]|nr:NADH-quinone oxidoreductase subunit H [Candidatus Methanomethylicia archaeon]MDW7988592.1 complex I subunit 1 family protein [Nitrososphaerota archaeon]